MKGQNKNKKVLVFQDIQLHVDYHLSVAKVDYLKDFLIVLLHTSENVNWNIGTIWSILCLIVVKKDLHNSFSSIGCFHLRHKPLQFQHANQQPVHESAWKRL